MTNTREEYFYIKNYIWFIFQIKQKQRQSIKIAYDMFIANLELKTERYKGAKGLKYKPVQNLWNKLDDNEKEAQRKLFFKFVNKNCSILHRLFIENDRDSFIKICEK